MKTLASALLVLVSFAVPAFATVVVTSPQTGSVTSPVNFVASASSSTCAQGVASMGIYEDYVLVYTAPGATQINTALSMNPGAHHISVQEWDRCGGASKTQLSLTVPSQGPGGVVVASPANNSTVTSPVNFVASASSSTCAQGVASMGIYEDYVLVYTAPGATQIDTGLSMNPGAHHISVQEWDRCGGATKTQLNLTVSATKTLTAISVSPTPASFAMGATQQFSATATYSDGSTADVSSTAGWTVANANVAGVDSSGLATAIASGSTSVTASLNNVSGNVPVTVTIAPGTAVNITTFHVDNNRSGVNAAEQSLTPSSVSPQTFGKLFSYLVDGYVYGEPLLVSNVTINGAEHNVLYVATENDSVYAFDADNYGTGAPLWQVSLLQTGEAPIGGSIQPYVGVTSTPVIDPTSNTIYVVSVEDQPGTAATYRLNALDLATGAQKFGGPVIIQASVAGANSISVNGIVSLAPPCLQRAALLLANGNVYIGFGDCHNGWLLAYDAQTLAQTGVFNSSPNIDGESTYGGAGGIWMGGGGPAADNAGDVYVSTGNGPWDGQTSWGESVLKFNPQLQMLDYFTPYDYQYMDCNDADLASGGVLLLPGTLQALAGGKTGKLYLVNTANLGQEQPIDAGATQTLWSESGLTNPYSKSCTDSQGTQTTDVSPAGSYGTPAYFNGSVYIGETANGSTAIPNGIRQFTYSAGTLTPGAYTAPSTQEESYGTTPFISADGTANGILWMIDHGTPLQSPVSTTPTDAILRAYAINNLGQELYDSATNPGDAPGYGIKFTSPIVANGKVYISTGHDPVTATAPQGEIDVYGLK